MRVSGFATERNFVFLLAVLVSGCVVNPVVDYQQPADLNAAARLVVRSKVEANTTYRVYALSDGDRCRGRQNLGEGNHQGPPPRTHLAVGNQIALEVFFTKPGYRYCRLILSFSPKVSNNYLLSLSSAPGKCWAGLFNASNPDNIVPEPSVSFRDGACRSLGTSVLNEDTRSEEDPYSKLPSSESKESRDGGFRKTFDDDLKGLINKDSK